MDPNQTLADLIDAATDGDQLRMRESFLSLYDWMRDGGFPPNLREVLAILTVKE